MNKFIKTIMYFTLSYILLNLVFYLIVVKPAMFEKYIWNEKDINEYNLILVSDSHGAFIQDVPNEYGIFNLSSNGDNYHDMYLKIKYFSNKLSRQDTILLSIDNHQLSSYRDGPGNIDKNIIYSKDLSKISSSYLTNNHYYSSYVKYLPFLNVHISRDIQKYIYFYFSLNEMSDPDISYSKLDDYKEGVFCKNRFNEQFNNGSQSEDQKKYLKKIIEYCKKNEFVLIGIKFPITQAYWNMIEEYNYGADTILMDNNVPVIDMHSIFFKKKEYFKDQDHLNLLGGNFFCAQLIERIQ